ncbi:Chorismate mutase [Podosphaera aphanis]|nr:Chorismate mutase [Podosphaera aphanis]
MDSALDLSNPFEALDLKHIRAQLIRMEDTIIFHLIERAQFPLNATIYIPDGVKIPDSKLSFLDWTLREREKLDSLIRRFQSPDEYPFFPDAVQQPILQPINYPKILHDNKVNVNEKIKTEYIAKELPKICADFRRPDRGEIAENYGSSATADIQCLQALSRRIHFGKWVAESKFRAEREKFTKMIQNSDRQGILDAITVPAVELKVLERIRLKTKTYSTDPSVGSDAKPKINIDAMVELFQDYVIPLTKQVEIEYLMQRLKNTPCDSVRTIETNGYGSVGRLRCPSREQNRNRILGAATNRQQIGV